MLTSAGLCPYISLSAYGSFHFSLSKWSMGLILPSDIEKMVSGPSEKFMVHKNISCSVT